MLGPSPFLIWWTLHKKILVEINFTQLCFWQSLLRLSPTNHYLPTVLVTTLNTWHLWHSQLIAVLSFCCFCTCSSIANIPCYLHYTSITCSTNVHLFLSLTSCLYMSDTEGDWEWAQWGHWCRLVPTGGTTGTKATHTERNSEHLPSQYWTM